MPNGVDNQRNSTSRKNGSGKEISQGRNANQKYGELLGHIIRIISCPPVLKNRRTIKPAITRKMMFRTVV